MKCFNEKNQEEKKFEGNMCLLNGTCVSVAISWLQYHGRSSQISWLCDATLASDAPTLTSLSLTRSGIFP